MYYFLKSVKKEKYNHIKQKSFLLQKSFLTLSSLTLQRAMCGDLGKIQSNMS